MRIDIKTIEKEVLRGHKNYQRYIIILAALSAMVAAIVVASLIRPAVTCVKPYTNNFNMTSKTENGKSILEFTISDPDIIQKQERFLITFSTTVKTLGDYTC